MKIIGYYMPELMAGVLRALRSLPEGIRPDRFAVDEDDKQGEGEVGDEAAFNRFAGKHRTGYFLIGKRAHYNVKLTPNRFGYASVEVYKVLGSFSCGTGDEMTPEDARSILKCIGNAGAYFAFAACHSEYESRNKYVREIGGGTFEAWVGRDLRKYFPGLYWMTVIPDQPPGIVAKVMEMSEMVVERLDSGSWLVTAFSQPNQWRTRASYIDSWLAEMPQFFSKRAISLQLDSAPDIQSLLRIPKD